MTLDITVPQDYAGAERLDKYAASVQGGMNRSKLKSGLKALLLNQKTAKLSMKIKAGDEIHIEWEDAIPDDIIPQRLPLDIIYEDKDVTVVNKSQGMVTHPASGNWSGTLVNALLYHWGMQELDGQRMENHRPGIVHRLDKDTSGIIITARNRDSEEWLQQQFKTRSLTKEYILITQGRPPYKSGVICTQIVRDPKNRQRFKATCDTDSGKFAKTIYHCIACYGNYSLIRARLKTGRTHQLRVHFKYLGCPILGDSIYGHTDQFFPKATLMLHSKKLRVCLPNKSIRTTFTTKTPVRFLKVERILKSKYTRSLPPENPDKPRRER